VIARVDFEGKEDRAFNVLRVLPLRKTIAAFEAMHQRFCFAHSCSRTLCNTGKEYGTPSIFLRTLWRNLV